MPTSATASTSDAERSLNQILSRQRAAQLRDGAPPAAVRIDRPNRCIALLADRRAELEPALEADFGTRFR